MADTPHINNSNFSRGSDANIMSRITQADNGLFYNSRQKKDINSRINDNDDVLKKLKSQYDDYAGYIKSVQKELKDLEEKGDQENYNKRKKQLEQWERASLNIEDKINKRKNENSERATQIAIQQLNTVYQQASAKDRKQYEEKQKLILDEHRNQLKLQKSQIEAELANEKTGIRRKKQLAKELEDINKQEHKISLLDNRNIAERAKTEFQLKLQEEYEKHIKESEEQAKEHTKKLQELQNKLGLRSGAYERLRDAGFYGAGQRTYQLTSVKSPDVDEKLVEYNSIKQNRTDAITKLEDAIKSGDDRQIELAQMEFDASESEYKSIAQQVALLEAGNKFLESIDSGIIQSIGEVDKRMDEMLSYQSGINTRLQGSGTNLSDILEDVTSNLATSVFFKQTEVLSSIADLVNKGISYNVEYRGFLNAAADKIASTFDADSGSLLRIIRLQQADTTAARLGMEARLTQYFNGMFQTTEYLQNQFDNVQGALEDVLATMTNTQGAEFEYIVQKWLGSLSGVGMSDQSTSMIAQAINYLGTGNVSALNSNNQMQTLLAMSANRAGLDYASMLLNGLTSGDTNKLLTSMVQYLSEIADDTNNVVKSAYGDIFNLSMSDLRAISNLSTSDINSISSTIMNYGAMGAELASQLNSNTLTARTPLAEMYANLMDNYVTTTASGIAQNPAMYGLWKVNQLVEKSTGGINIPFVSAFGNGVDLNANLNQLLSLGMMGMSTITQLSKLMGSISTQGGVYGAGNWGGAEEFTSRGGNFAGVLTGSSTGTSASTYISNGNSSDIKTSALNDATDEATNLSETTNKNVKSDADLQKSLYEGINKYWFDRNNHDVVTYVNDMTALTQDKIQEAVTDALKSVLAGKTIKDDVRSGIYSYVDAPNPARFPVNVLKDGTDKIPVIVKSGNIVADISTMPSVIVKSGKIDAKISNNYVPIKGDVTVTNFEDIDLGSGGGAATTVTFSGGSVDSSMIGVGTSSETIEQALNNVLEDTLSIDENGCIEVSIAQVKESTLTNKNTMYEFINSGHKQWFREDQW